MIRVLIAEDEPPTLRRLSGMVEQLDPMFSVVATALNGRIALEKMTQAPCDLLITDIRMPVMDGMALMDEVRKRFPETMIVVLSGYQDFEYVSHAIRARSLDYLLKPVSADAIREVLARVKAQYLQDARARLRTSLAAQLNRATPDAARGANADPVGLCLFCAGAIPPSDDAEMYAASEFWNDKALESMAEALVPGFASFVWEFMGNTPVERICIFQTNSAEIERWVKYLHETLLCDGATPLGCACLRETIPLYAVNAQMRRLRRMLRDRIPLGHSLFLACDADKEDAPESIPDDTQTVRKLSELLGDGRLDASNVFLRELFGRMEKEAWPQQRVLNLFTGACMLLETSADAHSRDLAKRYCAALSEAVSTALSFPELEKSVLAITADESDARADRGRANNVAETIESYLRAHYAEHISNQTLAGAFGYVPSYISMLFKQRYALSPSEYLTQIRLEEAKALIKAHPEMLIREVAQRVGFKSQHHFSRIFKKNEGMWPTSYQA